MDRLGLIEAPAPLTALPALAASLGLRSLTLKRDDLLPALGGGTKVRKLDVSLAEPSLRNAPRWTSAGAIGSGHLVALIAAGRALERPVDAHVFWEPVSTGVTESLAYIASYATRITAYRGRVGMGLAVPGLMVGRGVGALPPGGSSPAGVVGVALGALEIAAQIDAGSLPRPDHVIVPLGSGGAAAGLRVGFALTGLCPTIHAFSAVEPLFAGRGRLERLCAAAVRWLAERGVRVPTLPPVSIRLEQVGAGYAVATPAGDAARAAMARHTTGRFDAVALEDVYSAKAMAGLIEGQAGQRSRLGGDVLFWVTPRRMAPLPHLAGWQHRLPRWLVHRLNTRPSYQGLTRRRALALGGLGLAGGLIAARTLGYPAWPGWTGAHLAPWEAHVLRAAGEVLTPGVPPAALDALPAAVDRYLVGLPAAAIRDVHLLLAAVEHGTLLQLDRRFSALSPPRRARYLDRLSGIAQGVIAWRGLRDLCCMGVYQQPITWPALGYDGPTVGDALRPDAYGPLFSGARPPGWQAG